MKVDFNTFINSLKETNSTLDYFVDFDTVIKNVKPISIKLHQLNYLLGQSNIKKAIEELYNENKSVFEILPILIAVRNFKTKVIYKNEIINIDKLLEKPDTIYDFIRESNLEELFKNNKITNLVDYVYGIETGLNTNARKNRSGLQMEKYIEEIFKKNNILYEKQVFTSSYNSLKELSILKKFDFVIKTPKINYLIEVNFYSTGGSKLNETAKSYINISNQLKKFKNFEFVWITDGIGWLSSKNSLKLAYNEIDKIYNLSTLNEFIKMIKSSKDPSKNQCF